MSYRSVIVACLCTIFCGSADLRAGDDVDPPRQLDLERATFERVPGDAEAAAVFSVGPVGSWYSSYAGMPTVDYDGQTYRMWFSGGRTSDDPKVPYGLVEQIGLATSKNGREWSIANEGRPVLELGAPGTADSQGLSHPYVLRTDDGYWMWYGGIDGTTAGDLGLDPNHVRIERICLAKSSDGLHWSRANAGKPVLDIGGAASVDSIQATGMHVLRVGDDFVMWYSAYNGRHSLAAARSRDGLKWTRLNDGQPLEGLVAGQQGQTGPSVFHDGRGFVMLYCADVGNEWKIYAATSEDGLQWRGVRDNAPVLGAPPAGNFDCGGYGRNHSVHPSQWLRSGDQLRIWYSAEDCAPPNWQRIGLMQVHSKPASP